MNPFTFPRFLSPLMKALYVSVAFLVITAFGVAVLGFSTPWIFVAAGTAIVLYGLCLLIDIAGSVESHQAAAVDAMDRARKGGLPFPFPAWVTGRRYQRFCGVVGIAVGALWVAGALN